MTSIQVYENSIDYIWMFIVDGKNEMCIVISLLLSHGGLHIINFLKSIAFPQELAPQR
jgi:hypothetical protein